MVYYTLNQRLMPDYHRSPTLPRFAVYLAYGIASVWVVQYQAITDYVLCRLGFERSIADKY